MSTAAEIMYGSATTNEPVADPVVSDDLTPEPDQAHDPAPDPATGSVPANVQPAPVNLIEVIQSSLPDVVKEARSSPERVLYSAQVEHSSTISLQDVAAKLPELSPEDHEAVLAEGRELFADLGLTGPEAKSMIAAGAAFDPTIPVTTLADQTIDLLNREFGSGAKGAYQAAIDLVARDPRIVHSLSTSGQGNNPQVVLAIAKAAARLRAAGKL